MKLVGNATAQRLALLVGLGLWVLSAQPASGEDPAPGAKSAAETHWAFQPLHAVEPPADTSWSDHPIDRFVAAQWQSRELQPVGPAKAGQLVRRLYFDLIGLPPSPEEVDTFLSRHAAAPEAATGELIDRLLETPQYGERWGRHWMDVARYADTAGDNADYPVPEARLYRDYIIDSFNADKPYDQFVREQLAGDILAQSGPRERYAEQVTATGFLALSRRYATGPYELWHLTLEDTIDTVGRAFLGLTLRCARCHDHKFDPVTTEDYYALYGIFQSTQFPWPGGEEFQSKKTPRLSFVSLLPDDETARRRATFETRLQQLVDQAAQLDEQGKTCTDAERPALQQRAEKLRAEHFHLQRSGLPPDVPPAYAVRDGQPVDAAIQYGGEPSDAGPLVPRRAIAFFGGELRIPPGSSGRLELADWLTRPENPLLARVMVNRIWQHHFGRGLVATPSNFGLSGARPTHPALLDFLAAQFIDSGWSIKAMQRLILTSKTWQLSSDDHEHNVAVDTGNEYYWRHDRLRLDAEAIRDSLLAVSGRLDLTRPGPHPFPAMTDWHWTQHSQFRDRYDSPHRSVYLMTQRLQRHPFLALFDGPDTNTTTDRRTTATVTPQALYWMNSSETAAIAGALAERLAAASPDVRQRIDLAHRWCYAREATCYEIDRGVSYVREFQGALAHSAATMDRPEHAAWTSYARILLMANEFLYLD